MSWLNIVTLALALTGGFFFWAFVLGLCFLLFFFASSELLSPSRSELLLSSASTASEAFGLSTYPRSLVILAGAVVFLLLILLPWSPEPVSAEESMVKVWKSAVPC